MHTRRAVKNAQKLVNRNVAVIKHFFSCDKTATLTQTLMCRGPCAYSVSDGVQNILLDLRDCESGRASRPGPFKSICNGAAVQIIYSWRGRFNYKSTRHETGCLPKTQYTTYIYYYFIIVFVYFVYDDLALGV